MEKLSERQMRIEHLREKVGHKLGGIVPLFAYTESGRVMLPRDDVNYRRGVVCDESAEGRSYFVNGRDAYVGEPASHYRHPDYTNTEFELVERAQTGEYTIGELDELRAKGFMVSIVAFGVDIYGPQSEV